MGTVLDITVIGLQEGAIYSLVALGLALVYKATKVLNFAHGGIGSTAAFIVLLAMVGGDLEAGVVSRSAMLWSVPLAMLVGALMGMGVNGALARLRQAVRVTPLVATVAIALLLVALQLGIFEARGRRFPRPLAGAPCLEGGAGGECVRQLTVGGVIVPWHTLVILGVLAVTAGLLTLFFRTRPGVALLATSQDPFAAELQGVSVRGMTMVAWGLAGALAAVAGILGAGVFNQLTPGLMLSTFLIPGFTAAVLGGMTSMVGAVIGGLVLGIVVAGGNQLVQSLELTVPGVPQAAVLLVLLLVLLLRPRGLLGREA